MLAVPELVVVPEALLVRADGLLAVSADDRRVRDSLPLRVRHSIWSCPPIGQAGRESEPRGTLVPRMPERRRAAATKAIRDDDCRRPGLALYGIETSGTAAAQQGGLRGESWGNMSKVPDPPQHKRRHRVRKSRLSDSTWQLE
ncbi:MAG: hypothetical protein R3E12_03020 [Candidatus Eisenbacteria bacterium]